MLIDSIHSYLGFTMNPRYVAYSYMVLIPVVGIYGLLKYRKLSGFNKLAVQLTLISAFVQDYILLPFDWVTTNLPLFHAFAIASTFYFGLIYKRLFWKSETIGRVIFYVSLVFVVIESLNSLFYQGLHSFPSFNIMLTASLVIVSSLLYFRYLLRYPSEKNIIEFPPFWFVSGNLLFYSVNFCFLTFKQYYELAGVETPFYFQYYFLSAGIIILYVSYLISFRKDAKSRETIILSDD